MAKWLSTLELSLSSLLILLLVCFGRGCDLQYLKAPPSRLSCNPYSFSSVLKLQCQVQAPASVGGRVEIQWFFSDTSQATLHIDSTSFPSPVKMDINDQSSMDGDVWKLTSSIAISDLTSPRHQGMYFCQVALDGNITSLSPSGSILLEDEDEGESGYLNLHPCSEVFVEDTMRCAGNIQSITSSSSPPSSSATSVPTTAAPTTAAPSHSTPAASPQSTTAGSPYTADPSEGTLILWVFVLVAVAVVFGMIIVALSIVSVGLCLKMMDTSKQATGCHTSLKTCLQQSADASSNNTNMTPVNNEMSVEKLPEAEGKMINNQA